MAEVLVLVDHVEGDEQPAQARLAHEDERRGGAEAAQRGHRLQHVAERAGMDDQDAGLHLTSRAAARSIQPP